MSSTAMPDLMDPEGSLISAGRPRPRICVASSFPARLNVNLGIVDHLAEGFASIVGVENVFPVSFESVADQVTTLRPDLVILVGSAMPASSDYRPLARASRQAGSLFAFWTVEDPYEHDYSWRFADYADLVFTNDQWSKEFYTRGEVYHLPTAASTRLHRPLDGFADRPTDVFFCGVGFRNRQRLILDALPVLERYKSLVCGDNWPLTASPILSNRRLDNENLIAYYARSKMVLNIGRDHFIANTLRGLQATTPGPRTFEAAMTGCVQLYYQPSYALADSFEPGEEIVTFNTVDELETRLDDLLRHPEKAVAIAARAQARALRDHTYAKRAQSILEAAKLVV